VKDSRTSTEPIRTCRVGTGMTRTPSFPSSPLETDALTVSHRSVTESTLFRLLSSSLKLTWCLSPLHTQQLLNRFIATPSHSSSDPALTASTIQKLINLIGSSQLRQIRVPYHLLSDYLVGSGKFLTIPLPAMDEVKDRRRFVSA
jgi:hypothetical protein